MSLIKQLWIGIVLILLLALGGSFVISIVSAKHYLEEQLHIKNVDNVASLALSMSQMEKDKINLELLLSAQFDSGHYEYIVLTDPQKNIIVDRHYDVSEKNLTDDDAPEWFTTLINFDAKPGIAQVQQGWQQFGTLTLKSHSRFAWQALWKSTMELLVWFVLAAAISGIIGTIILKCISSPLDIVIKQAEAISERRFITTDEPKTIEFQRLVRAMNSLSLSVKVMLDKETKQLEKLRRESQLDELTELPNRNHFLNLLESKLNRDGIESSGVIVIIRVLNLNELNHQLGRAATDHRLLQIAGVLHQSVDRHPSSYAGRLNGSDFIMVISNNSSAEAIGAEISEQIHAQLNENNLINIQLPIAACNFSMGEKRNELLHKLDGALSRAELKGDRALVTINTNHPLAHRNLNEWRDAISSALKSHLLTLAEFPVRSANAEILHFESPVRLELDNDLQPAGYFMPWAARLGLMPSIDLQVIKCAIEKIRKNNVALAINISADSLCNVIFREETLNLLQLSKQKNHKLWIEFPELCALRHIAELRSFANSLRSLGCFVGLEHVGLEFTKIRELQDLGLHYLKIDEAIIRDINSNEGSQNFVMGLCKIGHSLGIAMIAEGVASMEEKEKLIQLGVDGLTGSIIS